ncbi:hypothetical protein A2818_02440 [Candidatus Nomurabacteria bacterium RIFCSPHIGHO2_01_FULL_40_12]|uniref:Uncharacterized protein n=1 Tax=Candidatus Nomurabacteria bacterium RIFCSPHIGHO2_01_FULL_40_12 TaxID=1801737 RepID=A0A1F6UYV9_9BACT|nr:MAG: hypothetical protein A2818_02440 [Candidatus Nomurabacteria bacterium RIFCSPHIGHO2_01_FULL_40_12]
MKEGLSKKIPIRPQIRLLEDDFTEQTALKEGTTRQENEPIFSEKPKSRELAAKISQLIHTSGIKIAGTARDAVKLHMYNYLSNQPQASLENFTAELLAINKLSKIENEAVHFDNPLPTIGIEIENFAAEKNTVRTVKNLGVRSPHYEEINPDFSYSAKTQARVLMELIKIGFIPTEKGTDGINRIPEDFIGDFSLHINFGFPGNVDVLNVDMRTAYPLSDCLAYAYASPERLIGRKTRDSVLVPDDAQKSKKNLVRRSKPKLRLEIRATEFKDYTSFRMLLEAQRLVAAYFSFVEHEQGLPLSEKEKKLFQLWLEFESNFSIIRERYNLQPNAIDYIPQITGGNKEMDNDVVQKLKDTDLKKECRTLIAKYSKMINDAIAGDKEEDKLAEVV